MLELRLRAAARADLAAIDDWGEGQFGKEAADKYSRGFREAFALLRQYPRAGSAQMELGKDIRCLTHRQHRLFYRIDGDMVVIIRIVHHAMETQRAVQKGASR